MQQAITCANVDPDLCRYMASLGHNELTWQWSTYYISNSILQQFEKFAGQGSDFVLYRT